MEPTDIAKQDALEALAKMPEDKIPSVNTYQDSDTIADNEKEIKAIRKQIKQKYKETVDAFTEIKEKYNELSKRKKLIKSVDYATYKVTDLEKVKAEFSKLE
jgi:phosphoenolpyruvate carboxylase